MDINTLIIVVALVFGSTIDRRVEIFEYETYNPYNVVRIELFEDGGSIQLGERLLEVEICSSDDVYLCFQSDILYFAVPACGRPFENTWTYMDVNYDVMESVTIDGGNTIYIIRGIRQGAINWLYFIYSRENGLVALESQGTLERALSHPDRDLFWIDVDEINSQYTLDEHYIFNEHRIVGGKGIFSCG